MRFVAYVRNVTLGWCKFFVNGTARDLNTTPEVFCRRVADR
jgi:hypothetical protein